MITIGTQVRLKVPCLGNPIGALGVCYEHYFIGHEGCSVIFENGNYDGFDEFEQESFLEVVKQTDLAYNFKNVSQLVHDWYQGLFQEFLK